MPSDWQIYSRAALREGKTLAEASRSWREANRSVFRNPSSPESRYHHQRRKSLGELLRRGVSFDEARRLIDRGFDHYQGVTRRLERGIVHAGERNPHEGPNWMLIGGVAIAAWWLMRRQTTAVPAAPAPIGAGAVPAGLVGGSGTYLGPPPGLAIASARGLAAGGPTFSVAQGSLSVLPPNQWGAAAPRPAPGPGGVFGSVGSY